MRGKKEMKLERILRFIGNRPDPEPSVYTDEEAARVAMLARHAAEERAAQPPAPKPKPRLPKPIRARVIKPQPKPDPFQVNLVQPLVGWKAWHIRKGRLHSQLRGGLWVPGRPFQAVCRFAKCLRTPGANCTCGIYATNDFQQVREFLNTGEACGVVLGWGRYIRAENGWRCEYAYPARILIARDSLHDLEKLKEYRVPLYVMEPLRLYDPKEDGYEYWKDEEDWSFGTSAEPSAAQDQDAGRDQDS